METENNAIKPWVRGIQNTFSEARAPDDTVLEATNVNISNTGSLSLRSGYTFLANEAHSLFEYKDKTYGIYQNAVCEILPDGFVQLSQFPVIGKVRWTVLNNEVMFTNTGILGKIASNVAISTSIPKPSITGEVEVGKQAFACAYIVNGIEGPLSAVSSEDPRTITLANKPADAILAVYATATAALDGEIVSGSTLFSQFDATIGGTPITFGCNDMPGGSHIAYWRGRLLIGRGHTLYVSKALHYNVYEEDAGVYPFEGKITFISSLDEGIYIGIQNVGVYFLTGKSPEAWERRLVSTDETQEGASVVAPTNRINLDGINAVKLVAIWFTQYGFVVGLPSGEVIYPQSELLSNLPLGNGSLYYNDGRLTVLY